MDRGLWVVIVLIFAGSNLNLHYSHFSLKSKFLVFIVTDYD